MRVSALRQTSPERVTVVLEDGTAVPSTLSAVTELRLFSGKELDEAALSELQRLSRRSLARERALAILSHRPLSCRELRNRLLEKGEDEDSADYCVEWLLEHGFLDDARYAAMVVRHYAAKNYGNGRIRAELGRRGIDRDLWDGALCEAPAPDGKLDGFIASRLKDPGDPDQVRKISNALFRRGYSWEEIRGALRRFTDSLDESC